MCDRIPVNSLAESTAADRPLIEGAIKRVLDSGWFILGGETAAFENEFSSYLGGGYSVGVASGTDAIEIALRALGIGPGDLVATVSLTAVGTVVGIQRSGAEPVFVDVNPATFTMCPESLRRTLQQDREKRIRCILPVHLYGQIADMDELGELAREANLYVVEDCAQSTGSTYRGTPAGAIGDAAAFSFYPTKNLAAIGDGGSVFSRNAAVAKVAREIRQYGWRERYISNTDGLNSRLDELQSAVLRARLPLLDERNRRRNSIAAAYTSAIDGKKIVPPHHDASISAHAYHQYVVQSSERDRLRRFLDSEAIETAMLYPVPIHLQPAYLNRFGVDPSGLRETEMICARILCLPIFPELTESQVTKVANALRRFCSGHRCL